MRIHQTVERHHRNEWFKFQMQMVAAWQKKMFFYTFLFAHILETFPFSLVFEYCAGANTLCCVVSFELTEHPGIGNWKHLAQRESLNITTIMQYLFLIFNRLQHCKTCYIIIVINSDRQYTDTFNSMLKVFCDIVHLKIHFDQKKKVIWRSFNKFNLSN